MIFKCLICGHIHNEESTGVLLNELNECPVCKQDISNFVEVEKTESTDNQELAYNKEFAKSDKDVRAMDLIHEMAISGQSIVSAMGTDLKMPDWEDILILGNQLNPQPLEKEIDINTRTVIGKNASKPLIIETPIYITHMSFGAFPNKYSVNDENLKSSDAIEIKIGQSTKPGLGGQLEGVKVTSEIAEVRGKTEGMDIHSPATIPEINSKEDLKNLVSELRERSEGRPIGLKLAAGHIEEDLEYAIYSGADFVTLDGRGGSTGASPKIIKDSTSVPTIYALSRARKYLDENNSDMSLIITGGLRLSSDFAKALAMGADAIAIGTGALIAAACQQYKICHTGQCPVGVATQDEEMRERLEENLAAKRVENYLKVSTEELKTFARITGHDDVHDLNLNDIRTINSEISDYTNIKHV